ncbi:MAG: aminotransferase class III-fold pyridoxal phosphate-dependent enzyme [Bacteroidetes bacterium]|nr:aminotransferase class III-fold pyridoxal phosphate-dependent enzyme [Bacteroidota bacterium]
MDLIREILKREFNIEAESIEKLVGEVNDNYLVFSREAKYLFKESPIVPGEVEFSKDESEILALLSSRMPSCFQEPVKTTDGNYMIIDEERGRICRVFLYIEGDLLLNAEHTELLFESFGEILAKMDSILMEERFLSVMSRRHDWDNLQFDLSIGNAKYIDRAEDRKLVEYFHLQYHDIVGPLLPQMRYSIIQGDANDYNVIVANNSVKGIIDFGDIHYSLLINEVAVAISYAVMGKEDPVQWALPIIKGYAEVLPLTETEMDVLYYLVVVRLCISLCHSAHGKHHNPDHSYLTISEKPVLELMRKWITINPLRAADAFRRAAGLPSKSRNTLQQDVDDRWEFLSKAFALSYELPIKMERAAFQYMYDNLGNTYLDMRNNIPHVGHCHPAVVKAGQKAMSGLNTNTRYLYDDISRYSKKLLARFPSSLNKVFYVNSGSAASDLALRLAKTHTGRDKMMVMAHGYHGNTSSVVGISHYKFSGKGGTGTPSEILVTPIPLSGLALSEEERREANRKRINAYLESVQDLNGSVAGFFTEPIVSAAGHIVIDPEYTRAICSFVRKQGGLFISDEVQTGFGRLGSFFWGFEYCGVVPDIVVLGKPIGNGHPMAAVVCTSEIAESFNNGMEFFSSFGGNPVSCAIGIAVLDVIEKENLAENAREVGRYLIEQIELLREECPNIGEIRGTGLSLGFEIVREQTRYEPDTKLAARCVNEMKNRGILLGTDGPFDNVLKIKPPLCFSRENADRFITDLKDLLLPV